MDKLLEVKNLNTQFNIDGNILKVLTGVSFDIHKGRVHGVVGESGCGKSVTARSILRILNSRGSIESGEILLHRDNGEIIDLSKLKKNGEMMREIRGNEISMVFQEPMSAFSPVYTVGSQIIEAILLHQKVNRTEAREKAVEILEKVGMPKADQIIDEYPHQLSGGMLQRAMIAMALACNPRLLIADEPTTALDVTIQAQILELLKDLQEEFSMSIIMITHDMGVIAEIADNVSVMYLGKVIEEGTVRDIFHNSAHPYTSLLLKSIPRIETKRKEKLLTIKGSVPDLYNIPTGCSFHPRCPIFREGTCDVKTPPSEEIGEGHKVRCFFHEEVEKDG